MLRRRYSFNEGIQNFEDTLETALNGDRYNLLISVYAGWTISNPNVFFSSFPTGTVEEAEKRLQDAIRNAKVGVVGKHPFSHFVSTDEKQLQFTQIEKEILERVQPDAEKNY